MRPSRSKSSFVSRTIGWRAARRAAVADVDVVAVEGDVELAEVELDAGALGDEPPQALRERHAAGVDPDERDRVEVLVALDDLVGDARERPLDRFAVQQDPPVRGDGMAIHRTPFRPLWTELKGSCERSAYAAESSTGSRRDARVAATTSATSPAAAPAGEQDQRPELVREARAATRSSRARRGTRAGSRPTR